MWSSVVIVIWWLMTIHDRTSSYNNFFRRLNYCTPFSLVLCTSLLCINHYLFTPNNKILSTIIRWLLCKLAIFTQSEKIFHKKYMTQQVKLYNIIHTSPANESGSWSFFWGFTYNTTVTIHWHGWHATRSCTGRPLGNSKLERTLKGGEKYSYSFQKSWK